MSDRNKMSANSGWKKMLARSDRKNAGVLGGKKIAGKPAIAGQLTGSICAKFLIYPSYHGVGVAPGNVHKNQIWRRLWSLP